MPGTDDAESEHDIAHLQPAEWRTTVRSLVQTQPATQLGGGHTNKLLDVCYRIWCSTARTLSEFLIYEGILGVANCSICAW